MVLIGTSKRAYMVPPSTMQGILLRAFSKLSLGGEATAGASRERVLSAAFGALKDGGIQKVSTLDIAKRARVSKREIYALFENKNSLIIECIKWQAAKLRSPLALPQPKSRVALQATLIEFGSSLILGVSSSSVTTIFRLAISEAEVWPEVAHALNEIGRKSSRTALAKLLKQAKADKLIAFDDMAEVTEIFFALLWGDLQMRLLLGLSPPPKKSEIRARSTRATSCFLAIYPEPNHR